MLVSGGWESRLCAGEMSLWDTLLHDSRVGGNFMTFSLRLGLGNVLYMSVV